MNCKNNYDEIQKEVSEFCCLCSGRLHGRRNTHSDNLPEDVQKFIYETTEICGQCICNACG